MTTIGSSSTAAVTSYRAIASAVRYLIQRTRSHEVRGELRLLAVHYENLADAAEASTLPDSSSE